MPYMCIIIFFIEYILITDIFFGSDKNKERLNFSCVIIII